MRVLVVLTCFNRREKTKKALLTLAGANPGCDFTFVVADDGSTDGTGAMLDALGFNHKLHLLTGGGNWFYSGGMYAAMKYALDNLSADFNYLLMINDDVEFADNAVLNMIEQSMSQDDAVIAGAMCDSHSRLSYGAVKYISGYKYRKLTLEEWNLAADTFNANGVLIPYKAFRDVGALDSFYKHSLGDFDYGLSLKRAGYSIYQSKSFVGVCDKNEDKGTWTDRELGKIERFKRKESVKGAPAREWFYFLKKNFGILKAVKGTITPFVRIIIGK